MIFHKLYTGKYHEIPEEIEIFRPYIRKKFNKFSEKYNRKYLIYSYGISGITGTRVISIVHPFDEFNPKTAEDIITGRMNRMDGLHKRKPYEEIPIYIEVVT